MKDAGTDRAELETEIIEGQETIATVRALLSSERVLNDKEPRNV